MTEREVVVAVDIGGTKVAAGVVDSTGEILFKTQVTMRTTGTAQEAMDCVHTAIRAALANPHAARVSAIGVASPGPLVLPAGIVAHTPNISCWQDFPLGDAVRSVYGVPTVVDNDANAAGLAEALWGAGTGYNTVFYITLGTGIGTAFIINGSLFYGRTRSAPEGGHMTIDFNAPSTCGCGKRGCVEGLASGHAIARRARELLVNRTVPRTFAWDSDLQRVTARTVEEAWRAGDPLATRVLTETADVLAVWIGNIIDLVEPDAIVVGGGLAGLASEWFGRIRERLPECSMLPGAAGTPIKLARYGADAGVTGAAAICFTREEEPVAPVRR